ncbi:MAG: DUF4465 domain-containing protein, partial [Oscillospiraceae bacterium]|nr:DUF4465 domain-containing protein [Oscillospiraceae bacterium]
MHRKTTKVLAIVLTLVMLIGLMPLTALAEGEEYELRTLTFEDADWTAGKNYAGGENWSSLIDSSQYGGPLLYPQSEDAEPYNWYDGDNTELYHELPDGWGDHQYWGGGHAVSHFAASDTTQYGDYMSQLTVFKAGVEGLATTGGGHNGSDNFAVHFGYNDGSDYSMSVLPSLSFGDSEARVIDHMYVNSTCYNLYCNVSGNSLTPSLGENDYVKLVATGTHEDGTAATSEFTLASGSSVVTDWTKWDLSGLGAVTEVTFNVIGSSDNGFGFSQPAYFAYDDVAVRFPVEVNQAPQLIDGVEPALMVTRRVNTAYQLTDLREGRIFEDPEGETLDYSNYFYQRSTDGGETWGVENHFDGDTLGYSDMILIETAPGIYTYRFYAVDSQGASSADNGVYWTLTLNVVEEGEWPITFYVSYERSAGNANPPIIKLYPSEGVDPQTNYPIYDEEDEIAFTDSTFGVDPENGEPSGTAGDSFRMYYAMLQDGWYVYRGWAWNPETEAYDVDLGGMQLFIPTDENADGTAGGGTDIYLKTQYIAAKFGSGYLAADEFTAEVRCPIMQCTAIPGAVQYSNNRAYATHLLYAGGNSCLYNYTVKPVDTTVYASNTQINQTVPVTGSAYRETSINIYSAGVVSVEVPVFAEFNLYQQMNNFNTITIPPDSVVENGETKTCTFTVGVPSSASTRLNYSWRLSDPNGVYRTKTDFTVPVGTWSVDFDSTDRKTHDKSGLGNTIRDSDDADVMVNLDPRGYASFTETRRVRAYRFWEIVNSITANIMMEPDFNWQVLVGSEDDIVTLSGGNTGDNWADVTPTGTDIVAVSYDAIDAGSGSLVGVFPATTPHRTAVFVATNEPQGSADANISYNTDGTAQSRGDEWDYFYDTWYYLDSDEAPALDFTLTGEAQVDYAFVTTNDDLVSTLSDWTSLTAADGVYTVPLIGFREAGTKGGTVIIRMTAADGVSYRLARVSEMRVEIENSTNPGEPIMPGNEITATVYDTFRGMYKIAGIFNPQAFRVEYFFNGELVSANVSSQYGVANGLKITLTVPEDVDFGESDAAELVLTGGHAFTQMFSAPNPFDLLYSMTDNGVGTNFNASTVKVSFQHLADVPFTVNKTVTYDMRLELVDEDGPVEGCNITLTDPEGNTLTPGEDGLYHGLVYGEYPYSIGKAGYLANNGAITLGSADAAELTDGVVVRTITLEKAAEGGWDGVTYTEPAADENGVYQIATGAELAWFMDHVNSGGGDASAVLIADIDLANYPWTPIGGENVFSGSFDGQGHTVSHLFIDRRLEANAAPRLGLFGVVEGTEDAPAVVKDLTVEGSIAI